MIKIRHTSDKDYFQFWGVYIQQNVLPFTDDHKVTVLWKRSASPGKGRWPHINVEILCRSLNEKIYQNHWNFQISYSNQYAKYHIWPYSTTQTKSIGIFFGGGGLPAWLFHCRPLPLRCWLSQTWSVSWWCTRSVYLLPYLHHRRCPILSLSRQTLQS